MEIYLYDLIKEALIPQVSNVVCILADTEYLKYMGAVRKFTVKARGGDLKISFQQNQSGVSYILLPDGASYNEDLIKTPADFIIYFQSPTASAILEVITWQ